MRKLTGILLISSLLLNACASSPQVIIKYLPSKDERIRLAILPFKDAPGAPGSGEIAAESITTYLLKVPSYDIIERRYLDQILKEQNLGITGVIDEETAAKIGKMLGADAIVVGAVTYYQKRNYMVFPPAKATVTARMVRTSTGTVEWSGTHTVGWHPLKWVSLFPSLLPIFLIFALTSPPAEDRINKAVNGIADVITTKAEGK